MKRLSINLEQKSPKKARNLILKLTFLVIFLVVILELWMVNRLSTYGAKLNQIKQAQVELVIQNQVLENKIAEATSIKQAQEYSTELGFVEPNKVDYLISQSVAYAH